MADLNDIIGKIDQLKVALDELGPLDQDMKERLAQKIRLEWNFHSNVIEGNQLDWGETRSLLLHGLTASGKPLKDHLDMKGHNEALKKLEEMADMDIKITENLISEFHKIIVKDPFEEHPEVLAGEYKRTSNYLYNEQNERIDFLEPEKVPAALNELINWTNNAIFIPKRKKKKYETHPLLIATIFHMRFINIHPFEDGNGRICRIMMNIILIQCGFPPIIIKKEDRRDYFNAIQKSREEGESFLAIFLGKGLIRSLDLYLKAAKGQSLEEPDDLDKKLAVLEKELEGVAEEEEVKYQFGYEALIVILNGWFTDLIQKTIPSVQRFNRFFVETRHTIYSSHQSLAFVDESPEKLLNEFISQIKEHDVFNFRSRGYRIGLNTHFGSFKKGGINSFGCSYRLEVEFDTIKYSLSIDEFSPDNSKSPFLIEKLLHQPVTDEEIGSVVESFTDTIFQHIDHHSKEAGLR